MADRNLALELKDLIHARLLELDRILLESISYERRKAIEDLVNHNYRILNELKTYMLIHHKDKELPN